MRLEAIKGTVPMPLDPPWQCGFWSRCPERIAGRCDKAVPALAECAGAAAGHRVRCFLRADGEEPRPAEAPAKARRPRGHREAGGAPVAPIESAGGGEA